MDQYGEVNKLFCSAKQDSGKMDTVLQALLDIALVPSSYDSCPNSYLKTVQYTAKLYYLNNVLGKTAMAFTIIISFRHGITANLHWPKFQPNHL